MRFFKSILPAVLAIGLAAYAFDCGGFTTEEQAMNSCKSMPCAPQGHHSDDCCKTMPSMRLTFVQTPSVHGATVVPLATALVGLPIVEPAANDLRAAVVAVSHAPPGSTASTPSPLRI